MAQDTNGIFISYRREETTPYAGWLEDKLSEHFGEHKVFRDIDSIEPGLDFVDAVQRALGSCEVLIAVIGNSWLTVADTTGQQRLQNPQDYVRMEIATALKRNIRVIPVLVQGARIPSAAELPDDVAPLARRNAFELHDSSWGDDVKRLVTRLERVVESKRVERSEGPDSTSQPLQSPQSLYEQLKRADKAADVWAKRLVLALLGFVVLIVIIGALAGH